MMRSLTWMLVCWTVFLEGVRLTLHLRYIILRRMLSTPAVNNILLPYGSIITRILRYFRIPITEPMYDETKRLGGEIILGINFHRRNGEWVKITSSKNEDTLLAPEDDRLLNNIYSVYKLTDFRLIARPRIPRRATAAHAEEP